MPDPTHTNASPHPHQCLTPPTPMPHPSPYPHPPERRHRFDRRESWRQTSQKGEGVVISCISNAVRAFRSHLLLSNASRVPHLRVNLLRVSVGAEEEGQEEEKAQSCCSEQQAPFLRGVLTVSAVSVSAGRALVLVSCTHSSLLCDDALISCILIV